MARSFTPEDSVRLKSVSDSQISPDGQAVAFVCGDSFTASGKDAPKLPRSRIYLAHASRGHVEGAPQEFTAGPRSDSAPRWSPDGSSLAFLSDREKDGERQIYLLPAAGGEARRLTAVEGSIPNPRSLNPLKWFADGSRLGFLLIDGDSADDKRRTEAGDDAIEFEARPKYQRLWTVDPSTGGVECVSPDGLQVWEFDISPDGTRAVAVVSDQPYEWDWYRCRITVFDLKGGNASTVYHTKRQVAKATWSPDGRQIAFLTSNWSDRGVDAGDVMLMPATGGQARNLTEGQEASFDSLRWHEGQIIAGANVDGGSGVASIDPASGHVEWIWRGRVAMSGWSMAGNGALSAVFGRLDAPRQVYVAAPGSTPGKGGLEWRQVTRLHEDLAEAALPTYSEVRWKASDGLELQGFLAVPSGKPNGPLPTVLLVHGGPTSACRAGIEDSHRWAAFLAGAGLAVFMPNYRGSTGRGVAFAESNIGDMGGKDLGDMLSGLDHLVSQGVADPERLGIAGWSYGGFTAMWAITQTDRFKAAVAGAGISDWRSFHGKSYLQTWDSIHYGDADPYDSKGPHSRFSAINYIRKVRTPTLILHGEQDGDVPVEQSYQFFRALRELGVETSLVVFPRERHGPTEYNHVLDINRRAADWLVERLARRT
jgi:dipeptidyl aminopeptidase/acylaminoacyl peptidase